ADDAANNRTPVTIHRAADPSWGISGMLWLLPDEGPWSGDPSNPAICACPDSYVSTATLTGSPGTIYLATLRFRGLIEERPYLHGYNDGAQWQVGGAPDLSTSDGWNQYLL